MLTYVYSTRSFKAPDGQTYTWKRMYYQDANPDEGSYYILRRKQSKEMMATTQRLDVDGRDGSPRHAEDYPIYITAAGMRMLDVCPSVSPSQTRADLLCSRLWRLWQCWSTLRCIGEPGDDYWLNEHLISGAFYLYP